MPHRVKGKKFLARVRPEFVDEHPVITQEHMAFVKSKMETTENKKLICGFSVEEGWADFYEDEDTDWMAKMEGLIGEAAAEMTDSDDSKEEEEDSDDSEDSEDSDDSEDSIDIEGSESVYKDLIEQLKWGEKIQIPSASSGRFLLQEYDEKTGEVSLEMEKVPDELPDEETIRKFVGKTAKIEAPKTESKVVEVVELSEEDSEGSDEKTDSDGSDSEDSEDSESLDEDLENSSKISKEEGFNLDDVKMVFEKRAKEEAEKRSLELSKMPYLTTPQLLIFVLFVPIVIAFWMHQFDIDYGFFGIFDF